VLGVKQSAYLDWVEVATEGEGLAMAEEELAE
jgi:hypothetical protein